VPDPSDQEKAAAILRLEADGGLNEDQQAKLDGLRKGGHFPKVDIQPDDPAFGAYEDQHKVPKGLLHAMLAAENQHVDAHATSPTGVKGLMQVTLGTGGKYGLTAHNRTNPYMSLRVGAHLLSDLLAEHNGDVPSALRAYKGHGRLDASDADYIRKVLGAWQR
jgi:hypothetical protein